MAIQFRKEAMSRFSAPEELKDNVAVANPRIVLGLIGAAICLFGFLAWAFVGNIIISTNVQSIYKNGALTCFSSTNENLEAGMQVLVEGKSGTVVSVSKQPVSKADIAKGFQDYEMFYLDLQEFQYVIKADISGLSEGIQTATIVQERVHPISLVFSEGA